MDRTSELDPGVHIAQGRDEHLECGGEPLSVAPAAAQVDQGVAQGRGGDHTADYDGDDRKPWSEAREKVGARGPAMQGLDGAGQDRRIWLDPAPWEREYGATAPQVPCRRPRDPRASRGGICDGQKVT